MNKIIKAIIRQYDIGQWWGGFSNAFSNIAMFITLFNTLLIIPMAYVTWFTPWASGLGLVIPFTVFISVIFVVGIVMLLLGYKVLTPSGFVFWAAQFWKHNNPLRKKLNKIEKNQDNQDKRLSAIEETLNRIEKQTRKD